MADSEQLRKRASQLFALALNARERGFASAAELEKLASESLARAEYMERRASAPPRPEAPHQIAQEQQLPQPARKK